MGIGRFFLGLCAFFCCLGRSPATNTCKLKAKFTLSGYKDVEKKSVVIGGMFPVHKSIESIAANSSRAPVSSGCEGFNFRTFRWTQTMIFAIDEINNNDDLLPNTDLGYVIYDSCFTISKAVEGTLTYLTGQDEAVPNYRCGNGAPLSALVGPGGTDLAIATARILGLYHVPQVSYSSTCSFLATRYQFPTFSRTIPSDMHQSTAMAQLVLHFGWMWVGTIAADDDYGKYGIKDFKEQVEEAGVCISFSETLPKVSSPEDIQRIVDTVIESTAKIIVVFSSDVDLSPLVLELLRHNVTNRTWIASEAWITSALINQPGVGSLLGGTVGFGVRRADIPDLQRHLLDLDPYDDPLTELFWEAAFDCTLDSSRAMREAKLYQQQNYTMPRSVTGGPVRLCSGTESLAQLNNTYSDVSQLRITYSVYKAVYAVANALHNLESCVDGTGPFKGKSCADITKFEPWQLMYYLKHVRFTVPHTNEEVFFTDGDVEGFYDIINWQVSGEGEVSYVTVGHYNGSAADADRLSLANGSIMWNNEDMESQAKYLSGPPRSVCSENCLPGTRKGIRQGEPVCCFDCIPCADGEVSSTINARECILCSEDDWSNAAHDTCIPKIIEYLARDEDLGMVLIGFNCGGAVCCFLVALIFLVRINTPLGKANDPLLSLLMLFGMMVTFCSSVLYLGKPFAWSCMSSQVSLALGFSLILSCIMAKGVVLMLRALALKRLRARVKAAVKAAKEAALAAASDGGPDIIATSTNNNADTAVSTELEKDVITPLHQRALMSAALLIQVILCIIWLVVVPPLPFKNTVAKPTQIILECTTGSDVLICVVFGYDILLAIISFSFTFMARKLEDNCREGKCLAFGLMVFFIVWIAYIPAYLSTRGKFKMAVQLFAILASSFGMLICIFLPKCYVMVAKTDRNTEEAMRPRPKLKDVTGTGTSASLATTATTATTAIDD